MARTFRYLRVGLNEAFHTDFWLAILAEYLATLFLLFAVSGSSLRWEGAPTIFQQALAAGLSTASAIQAFRSVSLPLVHGNPAVSIAAFITGDASLVRVTCSIFAQMFGAITGTGIIMAISPEHARGKLGATIPAKDVSGAQAFGVELVASFLLVLTMLASIEANKDVARRDYGTAAALGVVVTLCYLIALPITGCGVNPARSFAPAVLADTWKEHWVYWAGPLMASLLAGFLHCLLFKNAERHQERSASTENELDEAIIQ
ncbi:lens fiber major intrinsic protein-like [Acropora muricata]|uniref:lens fiber major intrinsic protein-like n=1 Tax=Acropora muricata TaxID=159855 RepID=UPI0034E51406